MHARLSITTILLTLTACAASPQPAVGSDPQYDRDATWALMGPAVCDREATCSPASFVRSYGKNATSDDCVSARASEWTQPCSKKKLDACVAAYANATCADESPALADPEDCSCP